MKRLLQLSIGLIGFGAVLLLSGYFLDNHRCKQINYEQAGYEMPVTYLLSAKQCLAAANSVKMRSFARNL